MSRKYNTKHPERGTSNYPARLHNRGLGKSPEMPTLEALRKKQVKEGQQGIASILGSIANA
jgi:hypothetical protein